MQKVLLTGIALVALIGGCRDQDARESKRGAPGALADNDRVTPEPQIAHPEVSHPEVAHPDLPRSASDAPNGLPAYPDAGVPMQPPDAQPMTR